MDLLSLISFLCTFVMGVALGGILSDIWFKKFLNLINEELLKIIKNSQNGGEK